MIYLFHPTSHGVALEYVKSLALNCPSSSLVQDLIGDHDEFCQRLALDTSTSHLLKKQADVYISIPPDCTTQRLAQTLNDLRDNTLFVWLDGRISKTNGVDRSQKYFNSLLEIIKSIGKVMIICSPWNEPRPIRAYRSMELFLATASQADISPIASKKECEDFIKEMREHPIGYTQFSQILDIQIEDTSSELSIHQILRENFSAVKDSGRMVFQGFLGRLVSDMLNLSEEGEKRALILCSAAYFYYACGDREESKKRFEEALSLLLKIRESEHIVPVLHNIAKLHEDMGLEDEAIKLYERCINLENPISKLSVKHSSNEMKLEKSPTSADNKQGIWRDSFHVPSKTDIGTATTMLNLACLLAKQGEIGKSIDLFSESLEFRQRYSSQSESLEIAWCLNCMAVLYESIFMNDEALLNYQAALDMRRKFSATDVLLLESLDNLAGFLYDQQKFPESIKYLDEALAIRVKSMGHDSISVASGLLSLSRSWKSLNEKKSTELALEAYRICQKIHQESLAEEIQHEFRLAI